jgi:hypothetical protein
MTTIQSTVADFQEELFKRFQNDHEGDVDEESFENEVGDSYHEELDERITYLYDDEVKAIIEEFGGHQKAYQLIIDYYQPCNEAPNDRMLAYTIIQDEAEKLSIASLTAYKEWLKSQ